MLIDIFARPTNSYVEHCPFCDLLIQAHQKPAAAESDLFRPNETKNVKPQRHVLDHLLDLFLMALPERDDLPDPVSSASISKNDSRSVQTLDDIELSFEDTGVSS